MLLEFLGLRSSGLFGQTASGLRHPSVGYGGCCAIIFILLRTYPAVPFSFFFLFFFPRSPVAFTLLCFFFFSALPLLCLPCCAFFFFAFTLLCLPCCAYPAAHIFFFFRTYPAVPLFFSHLPCYSYPAVPLFSFCCALTPYSVPYCAYPAVLLFLFFAFTLLCLPCCALIFFSNSTTRLCHYFSSQTRKGTE